MCDKEQISDTLYLIKIYSPVANDIQIEYYYGIQFEVKKTKYTKHS